MELKESEIRRLLGSQFLITAYIEKRLQVVNYIKEGYDDNKPVLINNRFLHYTAHISYRSIIIDLYALFAQATTANKYSFFHVRKKFEHHFNAGKCNEVHKWIEEQREHIKIIVELRNRQVAHYDFAEGVSIKMNFHNLESVKILFALALKIIEFYGGSFKNKDENMEYDFRRQHDPVRSLSQLVKKISGT